MNLVQYFPLSSISSRMFHFIVFWTKFRTKIIMKIWRKKQICIRIKIYDLFHLEICFKLLSLITQFSNKNNKINEFGEFLHLQYLILRIYSFVEYNRTLDNIHLLTLDCSPVHTESSTKRIIKINNIFFQTDFTLKKN